MYAIQNLTCSMLQMCYYDMFSPLVPSPLELWHSRLWSFKTRDTKLKRFLHKNQHMYPKAGPHISIYLGEIERE